MNKLTQFTQPYTDKLVAITNYLKTRTATTMREKEQTIIFTKNKTGTEQSPGSIREKRGERTRNKYERQTRC